MILTFSIFLVKKPIRFNINNISARIVLEYFVSIKMLSTICRHQKKIIINRNLHTTRCSSGYIVLVPEIGEHPSDSVLKNDGLPQFNNITIENCLAAIGHQAGAVEKAAETIENRIKTEEQVNAIDDILNEFEKFTGPLETTWGIAKTLYLGNSTLIPTKSYLNIHERSKRARATKFSNEIIYNSIKKFAEINPKNDLEQTRLIDKYLLEGKLNGLGLSTTAKAELNEILNNLGKERSTFHNKVNVAIKQFNHIISDYNKVRDFPQSLLELTAKDPNNPTSGPWKITLQPRVVKNFLKYCPDHFERWNVWQADVRKCSAQNEKSLETSTHIEKIRDLRKRQANLLGFPTFVDMSMQTKMIKTYDNAKELFSHLLRYAGPAQSIEISDLQVFASKSGFKNIIDLCDVDYWQRKKFLSEYEFDEESLKQYFPIDTVIDGLFAQMETILDIKIVERKGADVWHPSVKYFDVFDGDANIPAAGFYLDCFSNENKYGNNSGWMVGIRNRNKIANNIPLSAMIFNFTTPLYGKPYLLTIRDLRMLFKTFGTGMQHLLTRANYSDLAGLSNIEWDASQVCGHVMTNFLDDPKIIKSISRHYASDEKIPDKYLDNIKQLKINFTGYDLCKELYISHLDLELHNSNDYWLDVVKKLWPVYRCMPLDKRNAHPCSMTEIFSGDWGAAYFSHLYSKVIAADVSQAFTDTNNDTATGKRFKETFLALGGSICTEEVFRRFRGRDPSVEALLQSLNLLNSSPTSEY